LLTVPTNETVIYRLVVERWIRSSTRLKAIGSIATKGRIALRDIKMTLQNESIVSDSICIVTPYCIALCLCIHTIHPSVSHNIIIRIASSVPASMQSSRVQHSRSRPSQLLRLNHEPKHHTKYLIHLQPLSFLNVNFRRGLLDLLLSLSLGRDLKCRIQRDKTFLLRDNIPM